MLGHLWVLLLVFLSASGSAQTAPEKFAVGLQAYRAKEYENAKTAFEEALNLAPQSPAVLYNLALAENKLGQKGRALAHLRSALDLSPHYVEAERALNWLNGQVDRPFAMREQSNWELLRAQFLRPISTDRYLGLTALLFFLAGWLLIAYFGRRRAALRDEQPLPPFPAVGLIFGVLFLFSAAMSGAKAFDHFSPRGTILGDKTPIRSGPTVESTTLFELNQGNEVILRGAVDNWAQITYPGGMTGWVLKEQLMPSSGQAPW